MYGLVFINDLIRTIPQSGLAKVLSAYIRSELSGFPSEPAAENEDEMVHSQKLASVSQGDILDEMIVLHSKSLLTSLGGFYSEPRMYHEWTCPGILLSIYQGL
jgi:hypothetical protein